jgi:hypothetical protein
MRVTPKSKALQLIARYDEETNHFLPKRFAKQLATIAVDLLIQETGAKYWYEVKTEIEKYDTTG